MFLQSHFLFCFTAYVSGVYLFCCLCKYIKTQFIHMTNYRQGQCPPFTPLKGLLLLQQNSRTCFHPMRKACGRNEFLWLVKELKSPLPSWGVGESSLWVSFTATHTQLQNREREHTGLNCPLSARFICGECVCQSCRPFSEAKWTDHSPACGLNVHKESRLVMSPLSASITCVCCVSICVRGLGGAVCVSVTLLGFGMSVGIMEENVQYVWVCDYTYCSYRWDKV